ncbi:MAG: hypothetical protein EBR82_14065 [Caulobacteraceae bacterium]|nr:hypothetical protein [Caulobacteraceae bacterium]
MGRLRSPPKPAELAGVVQQSGLPVERYNAIAKASAEDPAVRARIALLKAPMPESHSVAADVTDDELERYVSAVDRIREITSRIEGNRTDPQQSAALGRSRPPIRIEHRAMQRHRHRRLRGPLAEGAGTTSTRSTGSVPRPSGG